MTTLGKLFNNLFPIKNLPPRPKEVVVILVDGRIPSGPGCRERSPDGLRPSGFHPLRGGE